MFESRWNCRPDPIHRVVAASGVEGSSDEYDDDEYDDDDEGRGFWKRCYVEAHRNPHDLWARHWNCKCQKDDVKRGIMARRGDRNFDNDGRRDESLIML